jgi:MFS family permease
MALLWWLVALFATAFVFYADDYVVAGVLPEIAAELAVSEAGAGQLVTVLSVTVALVSPVASVLLAGVPRRRLFVSSLGLFTAANPAGAAAPSFWNSPAVQARPAGLARPVATQALALNTSGTYLGSPSVARAVASRSASAVRRPAAGRRLLWAARPGRPRRNLVRHGALRRPALRPVTGRPGQAHAAGVERDRRRARTPTTT